MVQSSPGGPDQRRDYHHCCCWQLKIAWMERTGEEGCDGPIDHSPARWNSTPLCLRDKRVMVEGETGHESQPKC